ncbi:hypothetical protein ACFUEJ_24000, partial [Gordonia sp. NPDC057258]
IRLTLHTHQDPSPPGKPAHPTPKRHRLFQQSLQPWRQAVNSFFPGDDDDPDVDDLVWLTPRTYAAGDIMVYLVDAPSPAIIKIDTLSRGSEDDGLNAEPDLEWGPFDQGLSLRATARSA